MSTTPLSGSATRETPTIAIAPGVTMPQLGFGVWQVEPGITADVVTMALEAGYRSIDTAAAYRNEAGVGKAIADSGIDRNDLFITSKLANPDHGYDSTLSAFDATMDALGLDQLDLYLIHWPRPMHDLYVPTWKALIDIQKSGRVRAIGVSNFHVPHLQRLIDETGVVPAVNQIELHPRLRQAELRAFHAQHGITTEAWSPLASGRILDDPVVLRLAEKHGKSAAQVVIRWHLDIGNLVIPKSITKSRIIANHDVLDFTLTDEDLAAIETIEDNQRSGGHPDTFGA